MLNISDIESKRLIIQRELDLKRSQRERNQKGQFATPSSLAVDIVRHAINVFPQYEKIRFLDPAIGTGVFYSALVKFVPPSRLAFSVGYEIDEYYGKPSIQLWSTSHLIYKITDFTKAIPPKEDKDKFNLIICNPPYVRHHHIHNDDKLRLRKLVNQSSNIIISGLSGLYCYFLCLSHCWLKYGGLAGWLIPSEFMDINYGKAIKEYLLNQVTLLQIHRFDPIEVQFEDALVSSSILWLKNETPPMNHEVQFTYGGSIDHPAYQKFISVNVLKKENKWTRFPVFGVRKSNNYTRLKDFFIIKRGIATGANDFFILSLNDLKKRNLPLSQFRPILPSPRYLEKLEIKKDNKGYPVIKNKLFVLDCRLSSVEIKRKFPALWKYLNEGIYKCVPNRYLCKHRDPWYSQEIRKESLFYCTYIGRLGKNGKKPFRFILNISRAIVSNSYLILYPKEPYDKLLNDNPDLSRKILLALNNITTESMLDEGRIYGGGLHKLEPKELSNLNATSISKFLS